MDSNKSRIAPKERVNVIEGLRFFLSVTVIIVHNTEVYWQNPRAKAAYLVVNCFFVLSAFLSVQSLNSSWERLRMNAPDLESGKTQERRCINRLFIQYIDFVLRRVPPWVWTAWMIILSFAYWMKDDVNLWHRMFDFRYFPLTNFWSKGLRSQDAHLFKYEHNAVYWYMCCLTLFTFFAPIVYHLTRLLSKIPLQIYLKTFLYLLIPPALCMLDYKVVKLWNVPPSSYLIQHTPPAYMGKYATAIVAAGLWTSLHYGKTPSWLSWVPIIDCLITAQLCLFFTLEPHPWVITQWLTIYTAVFTPGNCLIIWAVINKTGCVFILNRILASRYIRRVSHGSSLFVFLLHMPIHKVILLLAPWNSVGIILSTLCTFIVASHAQDIHTRVMKVYTRGVRKFVTAMEARF
eukprot:Blabericola_migrator_1__3730@NODE_2117_length_3244_cov_466_323890_g1342_i0_p2_GENE_NODE_2117_length_3244_cov_466_323890_g1342_i0NODE_2117_length_3244_cov_466_323890_g1342_i0_p2_ORF_typecomplete_len404_score43_78Acyl_transf_3/PF01757_22/5_3e12_NODE_2117_length_3244_cov_466_323890_g1342_i02151426